MLKNDGVPGSSVFVVNVRDGGKCHLASASAMLLRDTSGVRFVVGALVPLQRCLPLILFIGAICAEHAFRK